MKHGEKALEKKKKKRMWSLSLVILTLCLASVFADLPVHCLHSETLGVWDVKMSAVSQDGKRESCGHHLPDKVMTMVNEKVDPENPPFEVAETYTITLSDPNIAKGSDGKEGTWTMVYDEGFEVSFKDGNKFFAFFKYAPKGQFPSPDEISDFNSICEKTFTGWYVVFPYLRRKNVTRVARSYREKEIVLCAQTKQKIITRIPTTHTFKHHTGIMM